MPINIIMLNAVKTQPNIKLCGTYLNSSECVPAGTSTHNKAFFHTNVSTRLPSTYTDHPASYGIENRTVLSEDKLIDPLK